jgi:hypothetical protein
MQWFSGVITKIKVCREFEGDRGWLEFTVERGKSSAVFAHVVGADPISNVAGCEAKIALPLGQAPNMEVKTAGGTITMPVRLRRLETFAEDMETQ